MPAEFAAEEGGRREAWLVETDYDIATTVTDIGYCPPYCCDVTDTVEAVICRGEAHYGHSEPGYYVDTLAVPGYGPDSLRLSPNPHLEGLGGGRHTLFIRDETGCTATLDSLFLPAGCSIYIPNAFSPNGDGRNDHFGIFAHPGTVSEVLEFKVFNRYGGLVYAGAATIPPHAPCTMCPM
ncbi:MAG: gliding motility-associated C-terminal domain-containing protein [Phaeodactylibacter sp.]|nr:gliding motility-associated C-terminal domain-containing protein [Phaeodactylibacter sp.]